MLTLIQELDTALRDGRPVCYTALVETRGSTPQKAGAAMLVFADGSQVGTLGGGCVEAEVKRRALALLAEGSTELMSFQLDSDYGWDDGLICGGRMKMLVDPLRPGDDTSYYQSLHQMLAAGRGCTEAIVIDTEKSPGHAADRWLLDEQGTVLAFRRAATVVPSPQLCGERARVRGQDDADSPQLTATRSLPSDHPPSAEKEPLTLSPQSRGEGTRAPSDDQPSTINPQPPTQLLTNLKPLIQRPRPYIEAGTSYLPYLKRCRLVIVGAGHVGRKVAELASDVGFEVWVIDDRHEYCNSERFPSAKRLIVDAIDAALKGLAIDSDTYCIIVTRGHNHDEQALLHVAESPARYIGMIGSRRKIKLIFDDLLREGISRQALAQVHAPLGFDIGSQTVPEIAISITAELIAHRNLGHLPDHVRRPSVLDS